MQGDKAVIDYMNFLLAGELAARDQYFIHSRPASSIIPPHPHSAKAA